MHKNVMKCNETLNKWCKNKHGASKIMDTLDMYHIPSSWGSQLDGEKPSTPRRSTWHHTKTSLLTVRPAYHAEWEYQYRRQSQNAMEIDGSNGSKVSKKLSLQEMC
jgi:hypothetical protein